MYRTTVLTDFEFKFGVLSGLRILSSQTDMMQDICYAQL